MRKILLLVLLGSFSLPLPAQKPWTLERCIQYGLEHNTGIRRQEVEISVRKAELRQRQFDHLPVAGISLAHDMNWGRSVDMQELVIIRNKLTQATGASLNLSLPLFDGLSRHYTRLAARKSVETATLDAGAMRRALTLDITRAWLELMLARQLHACARESREAIVAQQKRTARLVEAGSQPKSALNEMDAQVASEKAAEVEAACRVRTAQLNLGRLMNLAPDDTLAVDPQLSEEAIERGMKPLSRTRIEDWLWQDPRIRSARTSIEEMRYRHSAASGAFLPSVKVTAGYGTYYSSAAEGPFRTQLDENRNPSLSFQLVIPVFDAMQRVAQVRKSRLALEMARLNAETVRTDVEAEIRSAAIEADNSCQKYLSAEETLQAMRELLAVTEAKYNLGAASALDYIVARNHHAQAVSAYLQAKWQFLYQLKLLEQFEP
ncbi:MAG: TolC family protein [Bacteroidales bacterium]|nr:TolC family protein [Bacteroidales bacterium]